MEEFIRNDELIELSKLVSGLSIVKGANKQVFFQHQQTRLHRFDKLILTFVQYKQSEVLETTDYMSKSQEINAILQIFNIFSQEQYDLFVI